MIPLNQIYESFQPMDFTKRIKIIYSRKIKNSLYNGLRLSCTFEALCIIVQSASFEPF